MSKLTRTTTYLTLGTALSGWMACVSLDREEARPAATPTSEAPLTSTEQPSDVPPPPPEPSVSDSTGATAAVAPEPPPSRPTAAKPAKASPDNTVTKTPSGKKGEAVHTPAVQSAVPGPQRNVASPGRSAGVVLEEEKREHLARMRRVPPRPEADEGGAGDLAQGSSFEGRDAKVNAFIRTADDHLSTFAIDVDTAAYSIARRTLDSDRLPTSSLVRVEELINYFKYDYQAPTADKGLFTIQADGAESPVDRQKHLLRVGIQGRIVEDADRLPANLVFLVDTSCSMTSQDKLSLAKRSLKTAVDHLSAKDKVAITTYAGGVNLVLPPTSASEKQKIKRAIDGLEPNGGTAMASGLELAYKQAAQMLRPESITRIIVCSDGDANIGATSPAEILHNIEGYVKEGVTLSTIGFGDGNYKDAMMEQLANKGNGNYFYVDSPRQAERVFGRDLTKMIQDIAQDVKIQVDFDPTSVSAYRLVGYENRDVADRDFRNDQVDAGEIGAGHQVTALYELDLVEGASGKLATIRVRAKQPGGAVAKEIALDVATSVVDRAFAHAPEDFRFATAVMGGAELLRQSPFASGWTFRNVMAIVTGTDPFDDPDRAEFLSLMKKASFLLGEASPVGFR